MKSSLVNGLWFGLAGAICGAVIFSGSPGEGWDAMIPAAGGAAFLTATAVWWLLIERRGGTSVRKGMLAGAVTGFLAHPLAWYLGILTNFLAGRESSLGEPPLGPLDGLWAALAFSAWSWIVAGWLTVPVGLLVGAAIVYLRRKLRGPS